MNCRNCMTRVSVGMKRCPNCGRDLIHPVAGTEEDEALPLGPAQVVRPAEPRAETRERAPRPPAAPGPLPALSLDPTQVRALVAATPEWVEAGLRVHEDEGRPVGAGFATAVGPIDLLARDDAGGLVVVMVADGEPDKESLLAILERIGFVRSEVAERGQEVRGLLLVERLSEPSRYAIAALGGMLSVKQWRVKLSFEDVRV